MAESEKTKPGETKAVPPARPEEAKAVQPAPDLFVEAPTTEQPLGEPAMIPATTVPGSGVASIHRDALATGKTWRELLKDDYRHQVDVALGVAANTDDPNAADVRFQTIAALAKLLDEIEAQGAIRGDSVVQRLQAKTDRL